MGIDYNNVIVSDGLVLYLDAANTRSYSGSGTSSNSLVGGIGATLVNGVGFTLSYSDGQWLGFEGKDCEFVVDLSKKQQLSNVSMNFHNKVNERLNKPLMSIHDALKMYRVPKDQHNLYSSTNTSTHKTSEMWLILILILILIGWFGCIKKFK